MVRLHTPMMSRLWPARCQTATGHIGDCRAHRQSWIAHKTTAAEAVPLAVRWAGSAAELALEVSVSASALSVAGLPALAPRMPGQPPRVWRRGQGCAYTI